MVPQAARPPLGHEELREGIQQGYEACVEALPFEFAPVEAKDTRKVASLPHGVRVLPRRPRLRLDAYGWGPRLGERRVGSLDRHRTIPRDNV